MIPDASVKPRPRRGFTHGMRMMESYAASVRTMRSGDGRYHT